MQRRRRQLHHFGAAIRAPGGRRRGRVRARLLRGAPDRPSPRQDAAVRAGGGHACLVRDGGLWCWGRNDHGQVGDGSRTPRALPVRVPIAGTVTAVATGDAHTCAATMGGPVFCWGLDDAGQLGGSRGRRTRLSAGQVPAMNATALAAGKDFSCAVDADTRTVRCWGDDSNGQLGDGVAGPRRGPTAVAGLADVQAVAAAWQHACARRGATTNDSSLVCWGANDQAQIGDGPASGPRGLTDLTMLPTASASLPKPVTAWPPGAATPARSQAAASTAGAPTRRGR